MYKKTRKILCVLLTLVIVFISIPVYADEIDTNKFSDVIFQDDEKQDDTTEDTFFEDDTVQYELSQNDADWEGAEQKLSAPDSAEITAEPGVGLKLEPSANAALIASGRDTIVGASGTTENIQTLYFIKCMKVTLTTAEF